MERTLSFKIRSETKDDSKNTSEKSNVRYVNAESKKFFIEKIRKFFIKKIRTMPKENHVWKKVPI